MTLWRRCWGSSRTRSGDGRTSLNRLHRRLRAGHDLYACPQAFASPSPGRIADAVLGRAGTLRARACQASGRVTDVTARLAGFRTLHPNGGACRHRRVATRHTLTLDPSELAVADGGHRHRGSHSRSSRRQDGKLRGDILTIVCTPVEGRSGRGDACTPTRSSFAPTSTGRFAFGDLAAGRYALQCAIKATSQVVRNGRRCDARRRVCACCWSGARTESGIRFGDCGRIADWVIRRLWARGDDSTSRQLARSSSSRWATRRPPGRRPSSRRAKRRRTAAATRPASTPTG